jgi:hypothetical protein
MKKQDLPRWEIAREYTAPTCGPASDLGKLLIDTQWECSTKRITPSPFVIHGDNVFRQAGRDLLVLQSALDDCLAAACLERLVVRMRQMETELNTCLILAKVMK